MRTVGDGLEIARNLSAVILAGGQRSRFGRDKAQREIAGEEVLRRLFEVLHHFPFQKVAVMTGNRRNPGPGESVEILPDDQEGLGPDRRNRDGAKTSARRSFRDGM